MTDSVPENKWMPVPVQLSARWTITGTGHGNTDWNSNQTDILSLSSSCLFPLPLHTHYDIAASAAATCSYREQNLCRRQLRSSFWSGKGGGCEDPGRARLAQSGRDWLQSPRLASDTPWST